MSQTNPAGNGRHHSSPVPLTPAPPGAARDRWLHTTEERDAARLLLLQEITAALSEARDSASVVDVITDTAREWLEADSALVFWLDQERGMFRLLGAGGVDAATRERLREVPFDAPLPGRDAVTQRQTIFLGSVAERLRRYPLALEPRGTHATVVATPLLVDERAVGQVTVMWRAQREFPPAERNFLDLLTEQCAQALERAQLYDAERRARQEAERVSARLRDQQELSAALSAVPDAEAVLRVVTTYARGALGSQGVSVLRYSERTQTLSLLAARDLPSEVVAAYSRLSLDAGLPACDVVRTRAPVVVGTRAERDRRYPALAAGVAVDTLVSLAAVPLMLNQTVLGALIVSWREDHRLANGDLGLLVALANQSAQALDRAWLYDDAHRVAQTLQESLVPPRPPEVPGLQVGVRYRPVGARTEVGGDFYDIFRITPGRWGVVIGDVSGKGVTAAALTGLVRYTVRAIAKRESSPSVVLAMLNEALLEDTAVERFCTVAYLEIEPTGDAAHITLAVAGHPLPRLLTAAGEQREIGTPGMALGLLPMPVVHDTVVDLGPGDLVALYTDGVAEARAPSGNFAGELIGEVLAAHVGSSADEVAAGLEQSALAFQQGEPRDDLAVVTLRVPPTDDAAVSISAAMSLTLDCAPQSVGQARQAAVAFLRECGLTGLEDIVRLLTSEIVTNAVVHARTAVGLRISAIGDRLRVEARDASRQLPVRRDVNVEALGGRGLLLLDRLSTAWDVRRTPEGKTVWFELALGPLPTRRAPKNLP